MCVNLRAPAWCSSVYGENETFVETLLHQDTNRWWQQCIILLLCPDGKRSQLNSSFNSVVYFYRNHNKNHPMILYTVKLRLMLELYRKPIKPSTLNSTTQQWRGKTSFNGRNLQHNLFCDKAVTRKIKSPATLQYAVYWTGLLIDQGILVCGLLSGSVIIQHHSKEHLNRNSNKSKTNQPLRNIYMGKEPVL